MADQSLSPLDRLVIEAECTRLIYRYVALVRYARERQMMLHGAAAE